MNDAHAGCRAKGSDCASARLWRSRIFVSSFDLLGEWFAQAHMQRAKDNAKNKNEQMLDEFRRTFPAQHNFRTRQNAGFLIMPDSLKT